MKLPRWIENRLDFLAKESVYRRGLDTGVFIGRQQRELEILELLEEHGQTTKSVAGFLGVCSCGQAIDDYQEHLIALIKGEK